MHKIGLLIADKNFADKFNIEVESITGFSEKKLIEEELVQLGERKAKVKSLKDISSEDDKEDGDSGENMAHTCHGCQNGLK